MSELRDPLATMTAGAAESVIGAVATPIDAVHHFEAQLQYETDCWDVHVALKHREVNLVVLDVRSPALFAWMAVPATAANLGSLVAHRTIRHKAERADRRRGTQAQERATIHPRWHWFSPCS